MMHKESPDSNSQKMMDIISTSVIGFFIYPWIAFFQTQQLVYAFFGIGMILAEEAGKYAKVVTSSTGANVCMRPPHALNCNMLCNDGACGGQPGMPSGHMTITLFFLTFFYLINNNLGRDYIVFATAVTAAMATARIRKGCHNIAQVAAGMLFGGALATIWYATFQNEKLFWTKIE